MSGRKKKRIAVIVTQASGEALRMSVGLTLADDEVHVFIMDKPIAIDDSTKQHIEGLEMMGARIFTNIEGSQFVHMTTEDIARRLVEYDSVVTY